MRVIITLITIGLCIALVLPSSAKPINSKQIEHRNVIHSIHKEEIVQLTEAFMNVLVQDTDWNYRVIKYNNKESFMHAFEKIATDEVVKPYIDYYFEEENGSLYIVPTETPPWFNKQNAYDVVQLENNKVLVKQKNNSELYGEYGIEIEFTFVNQEWKITKITHQ